MKYHFLAIYIFSLCPLHLLNHGNHIPTFNDRELTQDTVPSVGRVHDIKYMDWKK
jgi:hypothetical protein